MLACLAVAADDARRSASDTFAGLYLFFPAFLSSFANALADSSSSSVFASRLPLSLLVSCLLRTKEQCRPSALAVCSLFSQASQEGNSLPLPSLVYQVSFQSESGSAAGADEFSNLRH